MQVKNDFIIIKNKNIKYQKYLSDNLNNNTYVLSIILNTCSSGIDLKLQIENKKFNIRIYAHF